MAISPRQLADTIERWIAENLGADEARCTITIKEGAVHLEHFERKAVEVALAELPPVPTGTV